MRKDLDRPSDEAMVRQALERVAHIDSNSEAAERIGVSEATIRRWRDGDIGLPLRRGTRIPLERFLDIEPAREVRERGSAYVGLVPLAPREPNAVQDDIEAILEWIPENMSRRWSKEVDDLVRLAEIYAYGAKVGWSADRMEYVHKTWKRLETLRWAED